MTTPYDWVGKIYTNWPFYQKSLDCFIEYSLDCLGHLTKIAAAQLHGKTKYVSLKTVVDLDLFLTLLQRSGERLGTYRSSS